MQNPKQISELINAKAKQKGLLDYVILPADFLADEQKPFQNWLENGMHGEMAYMARNIEKRLDPRQLVDDAKIVIVVLQNYFPS